MPTTTPSERGDGNGTEMEKEMLPLLAVPARRRHMPKSEVRALRRREQHKEGDGDKSR